ncbi:glutathione S-transferase [Zopfochytrium polystomum]|nr:glutathione S-transferase [Zopfochytrium polystomum]
MAPAAVDYAAVSTDPAYNNSLSHAPFADDKPTLFSNNLCPFAQRANLALLESGIPFQKVEINPQSKPSWYNTEVNPRSKVPSMKDPQVDSVLVESALLTEYVAEKYAQR